MNYIEIIFVVLSCSYRGLPPVDISLHHVDLFFRLSFVEVFFFCGGLRAVRHGRPPSCRRVVDKWSKKDLTEYIAVRARSAHPPRAAGGKRSAVSYACIYYTIYVYLQPLPVDFCINRSMYQFYSCEESPQDSAQSVPRRASCSHARAHRFIAKAKLHTCM